MPSLDEFHFLSIPWEALVLSPGRCISDVQLSPPLVLRSIGDIMQHRNVVNTISVFESFDQNQDGKVQLQWWRWWW